MQSFKWYVYEVQFWYKISVRVTVFSLLITVTYQWFFCIKMVYIRYIHVKNY